MSYHGGYEFQDRIAVFLAIKEFLKTNDSEIICESKQFQNDDFDDIIIKTPSELIKHQIKYSKDSFITQTMLSSGDLYFLDQYTTYKELLRTHQDFRLRIITNREIKEDLFIKTDEKNFTLDIYKINTKKIIENGIINKSFRKLRVELPVEDYDLFEEFLSKIEYYSVPKHVSFDFFRSGDFEKLILHSLEFEIGIGKYPNHEKNSVEISLRLEEIMQALRIGTKLYDKKIKIDKIFKQLGVTRIVEKLNQKFPINSQDYIDRTSTMQKILTSLDINNRLLVIGEPGVGKSWLVERVLELMNTCVVKYSFYISLEDPNYYERTDINALLYDLKAQIIKQKFATIEDFDMISSVSIEEVIRVINSINSDFVLILDGLDHIERISSKSNFKLIIGFVEHITNPKIKILCISQQIDDIKEFKKEYVDNVTLNEVQRYTSKFKMIEFSNVFFEFSNGNFLYLSYLTRKYKGMKLEDFSEVYSYDGNISRYYDSLLVGNDYKNEILSLISATNIPLNSYEIKEILYRLNLDSVVDGINDIKYLFSYDNNGNIYIYHESLKRYFLEKFVANKIDYKSKYLSSIINFFERSNNDFFTNRKKFKYYLGLLDESQRYESILSSFCDDFIQYSVMYGYPSTYIERNLHYVVNAAINNQNLELLLTLSEMRKQLNNLMNNMDEMIDKYYFTLTSHFKNNSHFINDLSNDFYKEYGRIIEIIDYIVRGSEVDVNMERDIELIKDEILLSKMLQLNCNKEIFITTKIFNLFRFVELRNEPISDSLSFEKQILLGKRLKTNVPKSNMTIANSVLNKKHIFGDELLDLLTATYNMSEYDLNSFEHLKESNLWKDKFYYVFINSFNRNTTLSDELILEFLSILKIHKDYIFKGEPRPVDFHFSYSELTFLIAHLLRNLSSEEKIIEAVSSILKHNNGDDHYIPKLNLTDIFYYLYNKGVSSICGVALDYLSKLGNSNTEYYFDLAKNSLDLIYFSKPEMFNSYIRNFSYEICAYSMRKDMSLECMIEGIKVLDKVPDKIDKYIYLLNLSNYVTERTDGSETNHFEYQVFDSFFGEYPDEALLYLIKRMRTDICGLNIQRMVQEVIKNIQVNDDLLKAYFYKTLTNYEIQDVINDYARLINEMDFMFTKDLAFKIYKNNSYNSVSDNTEVNKFISNFNDQNTDYVPLSNYTNPSEQKELIFKNTCIPADCDVKTFWELADKNDLQFDSENTINYISQNIDSLLKAYDKIYYSSSIYKNVIQMNNFIENSSLDDIEIAEFYLKIFSFVRGPWFERFEYFDILMKALDKSNIEMIKEYILNIISDDIKKNYYNLKSSSNLLKIFSLITPKKKVKYYEIIEMYETKLLPYFEIDILLGGEKHNRNTLLILLILEKMKFLNKESIVNSLEVLTYISQNSSFELDLNLALVDFYTNYDPQFSLVYALVLDVFDERLKVLQESIDKRKINESQDFFLKKFFSTSNELYPIPINYHFNNYVTTYLNIVGLPQFKNYYGIEIPLEKSNKTHEFQKIMNQDLVGWRKIPSVNNVNTIVMNELYYFIQELFSNYTNELLNLNYDTAKKVMLFNIADKIKENKLHFIPFKLDESIVEQRVYTYKLAERIENKSEHFFSKAMYRDSNILFEDVLRFYDFQSYHINKDLSSIVTISHKNIQIKDKNFHDNEETEVIIMVKSSVNKNVIKVTFGDYLSTVYNKPKKT